MEKILDSFKCKEKENCDGTQKRFLLSEEKGNVSAQYRCDKCYAYVRFFNGDFYSAGEYNKFN